MFIYLLWILSAWILFGASLAKDYVCIIDEPYSNPYDNFCSADTKTNAELERLEKKMEGEIKGMDDKLQKVQSKMEDFQATLKENQLPVQSGLVDQLQEILTKMESQLQAGSNNGNNIPDKFQLIGSRYFLIVNEPQDWVTAATTCRDKGGYLASFQSEDELNVFATNINKRRAYWLGLTGHQNKYLSIASNKSPQYLRWKEQPNAKNQTCVYLSNGLMCTDDCAHLWYFICQADNET